jgi:CBS domain-containing membrane protein
MKVKDIMTKELFFLHPGRKLDMVDDVMKWHNIRHIPIISDQGRLVGLVSQRDLLRHAISNQAPITEEEQRKILEYILVDDVMQTNVLTIPEDAKLNEAASIMIENKIGCLPVVNDDDMMVGILTDTDFIKLALN